MPARKKLTRKEILAAHAERQVMPERPVEANAMVAYFTRKTAPNGNPSLEAMLASPALAAKHGFTADAIKRVIAYRERKDVAKRASQVTVRFATREEKREMDARRKAGAPVKRDQRRKATRHRTDRHAPVENGGVQEECFGSKPRTVRILLWEDRILGIPKIDPGTGEQEIYWKTSPPVCEPGNLTSVRVPAPSGNGSYVPACPCCKPLIAALRTQDWATVDAIEEAAAA